MASRARPARSAVAPRKFEDDSDGDQEDGAFTDVCLMDNPYVPGEVVEVKFRGVDPSIPAGSKEWKKEKRLADNRASAARSRAMERLKKNALEVGNTQSLDEGRPRVRVLPRNVCFPDMPWVPR